MIVVVPLAALARDVFLYFLHEWGEEPRPVEEGRAHAPGGTAPPINAYVLT